MRRRVPSIEKIGRLIDYKPSYSLDEMLGSIIAYERSKLGSEQADFIGLSQDLSSYSSNRA
jgi:hypothetical protein